MSKKDRLRRKKRKNLRAGGLNPPADLSFSLSDHPEEPAEDTVPEGPELTDNEPISADEPVVIESADTAEEPAETETEEAAEEPAETETEETAEEPVETETEEATEEPAEAEAEETAEEPAESDTEEATEEPAEVDTEETAEEPADIETEEETENEDQLDLVFAELFEEEPVRYYEPPTPRFYRVGKKLTYALVAILLGLTAAYNLGFAEVIEAEINSFVIEPVKVVETMPEETAPITEQIAEPEPQQEQAQEILDALSYTDEDISYKKTVVYLTYDGHTVEFMFDEPEVSVRTLLNTAGVTLENEDTVEPGMNRTLSDRDSVKVTRIKHVEYTETVIIPATTEIKLTPLLKAGRTKELNQSSKHTGEKVLTYRDEYINGELTKHDIVSEKVTKEPGKSLTLQGASVTMSAINGAKYTDVMISGNAPTSYERLITGYCTAYNFNKGCWGASGMYLSQGFVAVDPDVIPYGSLLYITNSDGSFVYGWAIAADFCEAASWGWISVDLFFDTYEESVLFGKHTMNIYIVKQLYRDELQQFVARQGYFDVRVPARPTPPPEPEPEPEEPEQTEEPEAPEEPEVPEQTGEAEQQEEPSGTGETEAPEQSAGSGETSAEGKAEGSQ
ncbi:MAG: G5 domain-containing protein [Oscillospiraceae bacterium]|nr:G5 domain-containing protein [Oscillospiraceae bacterium]